MRPIDADAIPYVMLYKENWVKGTGREEQGVWKSDIDKMPTIEAEPVRRGKWVLIDGAEPRRYGCSECKTFGGTGMKVKITEIEATADELKASNSLADALSNHLRNIFTPLSWADFTDNDEVEGEE